MTNLGADGNHDDPGRRELLGEEGSLDLLSLSTDTIADLLVDIWKIYSRAKTDGAGERVLVACERAEDRLRRLGFVTEDVAEQAYDTNARMVVVAHDGGSEPLVISQCLSPAVYFNGRLLRKAEVVTKGT